MNGMKVGSTEMTLDGISVVDRFGGGLRPVQPGLDTIAEFRIETVGSDARLFASFNSNTGDARRHQRVSRKRV